MKNKKQKKPCYFQLWGKDDLSSFWAVILPLPLEVRFDISALLQVPESSYIVREIREGKRKYREILRHEWRTQKIKVTFLKTKAKENSHWGREAAGTYF